MRKVRNKPHILFTTEQLADAMSLCDTTQIM
jgi:hypothetical protein